MCDRADTCVLRRQRREVRPGGSVREPRFLVPGRACGVIRTLGAAWIVLALASAASAQGEAVVRGQVLASVDQSPLEAATVTLVPTGGGGSRETVADSAGRFALFQVAPGTYRLTASADAFAPREVRVRLEPREVRTVTLSLDLRRVAFEVDVAAEAPTVAGTHSPSSTVLGAARIDALPPDEGANLPEAIVAAAPGMIRGHDDFVHVRGEEVALNPMINGVSFWENPHPTFSAGLSPLVIDTANVMTGGFSAEYGNRFGGVIDIVTKSGLRMRNTGTATFSRGQAGRQTAAVEFGGRRPRFAYYLLGSIAESDRFLSPPAPGAIDDSGRGGHGFVQIDGDPGGGLLRAIVMGDGVNYEIPRTPLDVRLRPQARAGQHNRQQSAIVGWTRASSTTGLSASFYQRWSSFALSPAQGPLTASAALDQTLRTLGGKTDVTRVSGRHAFKTGIDAVLLTPDETLIYDDGGYRELALRTGLPPVHVTGGPITFSGRETGGEVSLYAQDSVQLGDRVTADVGVRFDRYALVVSAAHLSPRVNLALRVGGGTVVHASYNHFFVPPPIEGLLSSSAGLTERISDIGAALPPLEPTTEDQFEVGGSVPAGPLRVGLTGYYRRTDNPVHTTVWTDARLYSYASFDRGRAYGLEARAEVLDLARYGLTGYLNYALGRVDFWNPVTGGFLTDADHLTATNRFPAPMDQTHTLTAGLTYRHSRSGAWIGTAVEYGSGTPVGHGDGHDHGDAGEEAGGHADGMEAVTRVPGHVTADLSLGIDLLRDGNRQSILSFRIDVRNLADNLYLIAQEGEFTPGQYSIPRLVSAAVTYRF